MPSRIDFLRMVPYLTGLSEEEIKQVDKALVERSFAKGQILFLDGEPCQGLYLVVTGQIRIFKTSQEGREIVMVIARPGDSFNDAPAFGGGPNIANASAIEPSTVYIIPRQALVSLLEACPAAKAIINELAARLRHLTAMVEDLSFHSVTGRLAKLLLGMAVVEGKSASVPRLTQDEMAAMVGSVRDVIGRVLRALEKDGAIRIEGHRILVVSQELLRNMV
ncbi:MAG: Crp/Fnr family transcriptional regulator [Dehalococcoidales bacterium]|nr:Crp/Fnr family transcriptional regulator [Dehalococcoidales bacterium]